VFNEVNFLISNIFLDLTLPIGTFWITYWDCFSYLLDALFLHFGCALILTFGVNHKTPVLVGFVVF